MERILLYSRFETGHRLDYINFLKARFSSKRVGIGSAIVSRTPVFFLMIEECFVLYFLVAIFRSTIRRRTVGLLFRPIEAMEGKSTRTKVKRYLLGLLKKNSLVGTLTIIPFYLSPRISEVADDWIYDFQLWDLGQDEVTAIKDLLYDKDWIGLMGENQSNRKLITAIGTQNKAKGFDLFVKSWLFDLNMREKFQFFFGGKVSSDLQALKASYLANGGEGADRYLRTNELFAIYSVSSLVWCCYSEKYNQASGILGRAIQLGIPVVVRESSVSHKICLAEGVTCVSITSKNDEYLYKRFSEVRADYAKGQKLARKFETKSVDVLRRYLELNVTES